MAATLQPQTQTATTQQSLFQFVSELAKELSAGRVDLPSFPDAAARVQQALSDENVTGERIARVVSSDAGLAARILTMANSTLLHRGDGRVTDLKIAVTRIGHENIRTAALAYATAQLRRATELTHIRASLDHCWHEGVRVAALAHAMAKESRRVRADEAMLAGLLHNIGKIYILARTPKAQAASLGYDSEELRNWHPSIGQALIENWKLGEELAGAVGGQYETARSHAGDPDLQDLLIVAVAVATQMANNCADDAALAQIPAAQALGLSDSAFVRIMLESQTDIEMLQAALG
ncbi:MAG TPA: HDOD domain-containing protein [Steroidobacteraceae bacterium]